MLPLRLTHSHRLKVQQLLVGRHFVKLGLPEEEEWVLKRVKSDDDSLGDTVDGQSAHDVTESGQSSLQEGVHLAQLRKTILDSMLFSLAYLTGPVGLQGAHLVFPLTQKTSQALYVANQLSDSCLVVPGKILKIRTEY